MLISVSWKYLVHKKGHRLCGFIVIHCAGVLLYTTPHPFLGHWSGAEWGRAGSSRCISQAAKSTSFLLSLANRRPGGILVGSKEGRRSQGISLSYLMCWAASLVVHGFGSHSTRTVNSTDTPFSFLFLFFSSFSLFSLFPSLLFLFHTLSRDAKGFLLSIISWLQDHSHLTL